MVLVVGPCLTGSTSERRRSCALSFDANTWKLNFSLWIFVDNYRNAPSFLVFMPTSSVRESNQRKSNLTIPSYYTKSRFSSQSKNRIYYRYGVFTGVFTTNNAATTTPTTVEFHLRIATTGLVLGSPRDSMDSTYPCVSCMGILPVTDTPTTGPSPLVRIGHA